jgi:hypothetical protein
MAGDEARAAVVLNPSFPQMVYSYGAPLDRHM